MRLITREYGNTLTEVWRTEDHPKEHYYLVVQSYWLSDVSEASELSPDRQLVS